MHLRQLCSLIEAKAPDVYTGNVVHNCLILNYTFFPPFLIFIATIDCAQLMTIAIATCTCTLHVYVCESIKIKMRNVKTRNSQLIDTRN